MLKTRDLSGSEHMRIAARALVGLTIAVLVVGCANRRGAGGADDLPPQAAGSATDAASATGADGSAASGSPLESAGTVGGAGGLAGPTEGLLGRRLVYFDFDSDQIRSDDRALVAAHSQYLASNPGVRVRRNSHVFTPGKIPRF
jgi:peptidoglycan-associated lipoprotein